MNSRHIPSEGDSILICADCHEVSDNIDRTIFPNFESTESGQLATQHIMPSNIPDMTWIINFYWTEEKATRYLWGEETIMNHDVLEHSQVSRSLIGNSAEVGTTYSEAALRGFWSALSRLAFMICEFDSYKFTPTLSEDVLELSNTMLATRKVIEAQRMPGDTTLKAEDEIAMFHENLLMSCYGWLSCIRAAHKLCEVLQERVIKKKGATHPLLKKYPMLKDLATRLSEESKICFQAVRDMAQSYIDLIKKRGVTAIIAQVRWGVTGGELKWIIPIEDVEYYAKEYVDSALEAWSGVLKVKLK